MKRKSTDPGAWNSLQEKVATLKTAVIEAESLQRDIEDRQTKAFRAAAAAKETKIRAEEDFNLKQATVAMLGIEQKVCTMQIEQLERQIAQMDPQGAAEIVSIAGGVIQATEQDVGDRVLTKPKNRGRILWEVETVGENRNVFVAQKVGAFVEVDDGYDSEEANGLSLPGAFQYVS